MTVERLWSARKDDLGTLWQKRGSGSDDVQSVNATPLSPRRAWASRATIWEGQFTPDSAARETESALDRPLSPSKSGGQGRSCCGRLSQFTQPAPKSPSRRPVYSSSVVETGDPATVRYQKSVAHRLLQRRADFNLINLDPGLLIKRSCHGMDGFLDTQALLEIDR